jgi:hypothetical protein
VTALTKFDRLKWPGKSVGVLSLGARGLREERIFVCLWPSCFWDRSDDVVVKGRFS